MRDFIILLFRRRHLNGRMGIATEIDSDGVHPHGGRFPGRMRAVLIAIIFQLLRLEIARFTHIGDNHLIDACIVFPVGRADPYKRRPAKLFDYVFDIIRTLLNDVAYKKLVGPDGQ